MDTAVAYCAGVTDSAKDFPWLVWDAKGLGIIITFIWKYFPYIGLSVLGVLQGASRAYEDQAATLGVGRGRRFFHVVLPQILPATAIASIIVFAAAFGEYEVPALLGTSAPRTLSVMVYLKYCDLSTMDLPAAYVMMTLMSLVLMVCVLPYFALVMRKRGEGK